jgi:hypothetical protein
MEKTLDILKKLNPEIKIYNINDSIFHAYGKVLDAQDFSTYFKYLEEKTTIPEFDNIYVAEDKNLSIFVNSISTIDEVFGNIEIQMGYVNGNNTKLNALEYHKSSEINIALTPLVLILALQTDLIDNQLDTNKVKVFFVPPKTAVEFHPKTLHFSPCKVSDGGFKCGVVLPLGTNTQFVKAKHYKDKENQLLFKTNKWLLAHAEHKKMVELGAYVGLKGTNIEIKY